MTIQQPDAAYWETLKKGNLKCLLCPQGCVMKNGAAGICRSRQNLDGVMKLTNYGRFTALSADPIEKKPLYHYYPGKQILSIGGKGCNFNCEFCQNSDISQGDPTLREISPQALADECAAQGPDSIGLAFTYNEPFIWFEFIRDTAPLVHSSGQKVVLVTNGYVNQDPLRELLPQIDAMNVDLKSFDDKFYKNYCAGRLDPVRDTIETAVKGAVHLEVTLLLVPSLNDDMRQIERHAKWLASLSKDIVLHISRYFPSYKLDLPPTPISTMSNAFDAAHEHLDYVYLGNTGDPDCARTRCRNCDATLISRTGYSTSIVGLKDQACSNCGTKNAIVM